MKNGIVKCDFLIGRTWRLGDLDFHWVGGVHHRKFAVVLFTSAAIRIEILSTLFQANEHFITTNLAVSLFFYTLFFQWNEKSGCFFQQQHPVKLWNTLIYFNHPLFVTHYKSLYNEDVYIVFYLVFNDLEQTHSFFMLSWVIKLQ